MTNKRQARAIDIDRFARMGGTNFDLAARHIRNGIYDFIIIQAGLGVRKSKPFDEQRQLADEADIPYLTYHLIDPFSPDKNNPKENMKRQAKLYVDWVGIEQPKYFVDVEYPGSHSRFPNKKELNRYLSELIQLTGKRPILYTRKNILETIDFMKEAETYDLWIAEYVSAKPNRPSKEGQYIYFEDFLEDYRNSIPPTLRGSKLEKKVILWQFSEKGRGQHYIYNEFTNDPDNSEGKKSADLIVSIKERDELLKILFGKFPDLPKAVPLHDSLTAEQIEELVQTGISPNVRVDLNMTDLQIEEFTTLQEMMNKSDITPKIKIDIQANINE